MWFTVRHSDLLKRARLYPLQKILRQPDKYFLRRHPIWSRHSDTHSQSHQSPAVNKPSLLLESPRRILLGALISVSGGFSLIPSAQAAGASEQANIEVMVRQLNALEDSARRSATIASEPGQRYYFDYERLAGDIQRVRQGLQEYLTPSRAQPRDPAELAGKYTLTGGRMP